MSDRIIRDELLRSHRYVTLSSDTCRLLFVHLLLSADDLGNAEATTTMLGLVMLRKIDNDTAAHLLACLADADLIRLYEVDGKRYAHIPRFRQRLRYWRMTGRHPRPPENIECVELRDELQALQEEAMHALRRNNPPALQLVSGAIADSEVSTPKAQPWPASS